MGRSSSNGLHHSPFQDSHGFFDQIEMSWKWSPLRHDCIVLCSESRLGLYYHLNYRLVLQRKKLGWIGQPLQQITDGGVEKNNKGRPLKRRENIRADQPRWEGNKPGENRRTRELVILGSPMQIERALSRRNPLSCSKIDDFGRYLGVQEIILIQHAASSGSLNRWNPVGGCPWVSDWSIQSQLHEQANRYLRGIYLK